MSDAVADRAVVVAIMTLEAAGRAVDSFVIRQATGLSAAAVRMAVQRLRWAGKLSQDGWALSHSIKERLAPAPPPAAVARQMGTTHPDLSTRERDLLDWLEHAARNGDKCPSNEAISGRFDIGLATATKLVMALERRGLIRVERFQCSRVVTIVATGRSTAAPIRKPVHWRHRDRGLAGHPQDNRQARPRRVTENPPAEIQGRSPSVAIVDELAGRAAPMSVPPSPLTVALVEAGGAEIGDAVAMVRRRWPVLWRRVCAAARGREELPGAVLVEAVEAGLAVLLGEAGQIGIGESAHVQ